jgi:hypothetical protein
MRVLYFLLALLSVAGRAALEAAQPMTQGQADEGGWWGATAWILITLAFLVTAIVFVMMGMRRPTR